MSAQTEEFSHEAEEGRGGQLALAPEPVEVRRNAGLMAVIGGAAAAVAIAYAARAASTGAILDWVLTGVLGVIAGLHLAAFVDSRTPLMVADSHGLRFRLGRTWRGLPWQSLRSVEHLPRRGALRDGRLVVVPHSEEQFLAELDRRGRRQARLSQRLHGAPLVMPLGLATRSTTSDDELTPALQALAGAGVQVVTVARPAEAVGTGDDAEVTTEHADEPVVARRLDPRPFLARTISRASDLLPSRASGDPAAEADTQVEVETSAEQAEAHVEVEASPTPEPGRLFRLARRAQILTTTREVSDDQGADDVEAEEAREGGPSRSRRLSRPGRVDLVDDEDTQVLDLRVRPIARAGHPVAPLVIDDFVAEPAADPVIGPELRAARTRLGLDVDQLAERTRIRPHVIESIEVDDFEPCGGDFYARGHLRTLARVLGVDVEPLLVDYDARYAHAPVSPRRVFEAELASGTHGGIRGTRGGPNWSVLVAAVMAVVLCWSIARLVMDGPEQFRQVPSLSDGSGGVRPASSGVASVPVLLRAAAGGAHVVVHDGNDKVVFTGDLSYGSVRTIKVVPPVRVESSDGGLEVVADGVDQGQLGEVGQPATGTFVGR